MFPPKKPGFANACLDHLYTRLVRNSYPHVPHLSNIDPNFNYQIKWTQFQTCFHANIDYLHANANFLSIRILHSSNTAKKFRTCLSSKIHFAVARSIKLHPVLIRTFKLHF